MEWRLDLAAEEVGVHQVEVHQVGEQEGIP